MFKPLNSYVLIRRAMTPKAIGSIALPDRATRPRDYGEVVAVGDHVAVVSVGQNVYFQGYAALALEHTAELGLPLDDREYVLVEDSSLIGVLE